SADYDISVKNMKFGVVNFNVNDETFTKFNEIELGSTTLTDYVDDYIADVYDRQCQPFCVIPLKISGAPQNGNLIQINGKYASYFSDQTSLDLLNFFDLGVEITEIDSGELEIELSHAGFEIPVGSEENTFSLFIDGNSVVEINIDIAPSFAFNINPKTGYFGKKIFFTASTPTGNITNSTWDFGDGNEKTVLGNKVTHTYLEQGQFDVEVTVTKSNGAVGVGTFTVDIDSAKDILNNTIEDYKQWVSDLDDDIKAFPEWVQTEMRKDIDLIQINSSLEDIIFEYNFSGTDEDYNDIMLALINLDLPFAINISKKGTFPLVFGFENFDIDYIEALSGKQVDDENELVGRITSWMTDNYDSQITMEQITAFFDGKDDEVFLTKFKIETRPKGQSGLEEYLIMSYGLEGFVFKQSYEGKTISGGTYITLREGNEIFEFIIDDEIEAEDLGAYISPVIDNLGTFIDFDVCNYNNICEKDAGETRNNCPQDCRPWKWFFVWIVLLSFGTLIVYIVLQEWYKRNYERSLFPNETDLYNLINFIYNAWRAGLHEGDIKKKLRDAGWKGEKIKYALRKIDGRRTGMYEILFDIQTRANEIGNNIARGLEWSSKTIFRSSDPIIAQNILTDMNNGDIIKSKDLQQVQTRMEGFDQLIADWNRIMNIADKLANSFEVVTGESLPSGTPFRLAERLNVNANKLFDFLREKLGIAFQDVIEEWIL
ncbi:MAG: PKD domain-containing protein, partial [Bacteroidetes bacterium]|nr:PKD domain-containing protein [Bacteroidota bacterium]